MHIIQEKILNLSKRHDLSRFSLRQLGQAIGDPHPQKIKYHLDQLKKSGLLDVDPKKWSIQTGKLISLDDFKKNMLISVPIFGMAQCGPSGIVAEENLQGFLKVSTKMLPKRKGLFIVKAIGKSMNRAKIGKTKQGVEQGDYVVIDGDNQNPQTGDYVLSIIDGSANLKKFYKDSKTRQIALVSESTENFPPMYIHENDDYKVNGVVVDVIKNITN